MIKVECINIDGNNYQRGIMVNTINTITEADDGMTWIAFWDGQKKQNIKCSETVEVIGELIHQANHPKPT